MKLPSWYKWVILSSVCITTFFSYGYITSTTSIGTVYYIQRFDERLVSGLIGPFQIAFMQVSGLPSLYLCKKVGNRLGQLIGTTLLAGGIALTSLTIQPWQGLLLSGVLAGCGGGLMHIATANTVKLYFPGRQIAPFGAMALTINSAAMTFPQVWKELMTLVGWDNAFLIIGAMLSISFLCGFTFIEPTEDVTGANLAAADRKPKLSLIPRRKSSALFLVPAEVQMPESVNTDDCNNNEQESTIDKSSNSKQVDVKVFTDSELSEVKSAEEEGNIQMQRLESVEETAETKSPDDENSMWNTITQPESIALMVMSALYSGGARTAYTTIGDYGEHSLHMTEEEVALALTIMGALQIVASIIYIFLTSCTEFSAMILHTVAMFILAAGSLTMTFISTTVEFTIAAAAIGFGKSFVSANNIPIAFELTGPERAMKLYVVKSLVDGIASGGMPSVAVYIQETVNDLAALYAATAAFFVSGVIFIPFIIRYVRKPRIKSSNSIYNDSVAMVAYMYSG